MINHHNIARAFAPFLLALNFTEIAKNLDVAFDLLGKFLAIILTVTLIFKDRELLKTILENLVKILKK